MPASHLMTEVLPQPEGPIRQVIRPSSSSSEMGASNCRSPTWISSASTCSMAAPPCLRIGAPLDQLQRAEQRERQRSRNHHRRQYEVGAKIILRLQDIDANA